MEINTGRTHSEPDDAESVVIPPDKGRPARRKTAQKPQRGRHLAARLLSALKLLGYGAAVALAGMASFYVYRYANASDILAVRNIDIAGCKHLRPMDLEKIVRQNFPSNTLGIDLGMLRARLEQESWIRRVEVRRVLPSSLKIYIEERVPSVIGEIGGRLELLDSEGVLLQAYDPDSEKLDAPVFSGLRGDDPDAYRALQEENSARVHLGVQVLAEFAQGANDLTRAVSEIDLSDLGNVKILLVNDTAEINLGDRDFLKRFQAFIARYDDAKSQYGEMASVNLRFFPDIVYNPKNPPSAKPETKPANRQTIRN
jgi:cell division septal protein FtsQ